MAGLIVQLRPRQLVPVDGTDVELLAVIHGDRGLFAVVRTGPGKDVHLRTGNRIVVGRAEVYAHDVGMDGHGDYTKLRIVAPRSVPIGAIVKRNAGRRLVKRNAGRRLANLQPARRRPGTAARA